MTRETYFQWPYSLEYAVADAPPTVNLLHDAADLILETTATSSHFIDKPVAVEANTDYTLSVYLHAQDRTYACLHALGDTLTAWAYFDLSVGGWGAASGVDATCVSDEGDGWYRCSFTFNTGADTLIGVGVAPSVAGSSCWSDEYAGDAAKGVYATLPQLEPGTTTTDAIPCYVVPITIAWKPGMRQDFRDLRFRDEGMEPCTHRLESYTAGTTGTFLLEIRPGQERLSVLYGNGAAVSASDETFCPVLDAFSGAAVDTGIWTDLGGTAVSGGRLKITGASEAEVYGVRSVDAFGVGTAVRMRLSASGVFGGVWAGFMADGSSYAVVKYLANETVITRHAGGSVTSTATPMAAGYHVVEVARRSADAVVVTVDGAVVATHATNVPTADLPIAVLSNLALSLTDVDWITVRPCLAVEPTLSYLSADCNPWSPLVNRSIALFDVPFDWSDFTKQDIISFTVRRSAADAMYRAEVQIEGLIPQGTDYQQVHLLVPDHRDPEILNRIFYGFLPAQTSRMAVAANKTTYSGYSYDFYISAMKVNPAALVMPSTTNPATWIASAVGVGAAEVSPTHDLTNVHAPAAWGTDAMPAREFVIPSGSSRWQAYQKVADELGLILAGKWLDAGSTPTHNHQDPALRIIRVEAEDYDAGGEGVGYHDTTAANLGGAYRKDGVDIEYFASEAGYNVGWIRDGEWLRYTVAIPAGVTGNWTAKFRTASAAATGARSFKVYWGTNPASLTEIEDIAVDGTGSYSSFKWNTDEATLPVVAGGTHYLKLLFDNAGDDTTDLLHMNIAAIDLYPPPGAGAAENIVPALYLCDEADIDGPNGLDLPPTAVIPVYDPTLAGEVRYVEDFGAVANVVVIQYRTPAAPDDIVSYTVFPDDLTPPQTSALEGWIDHYEEIRTPITAAVAEAYGKALLGFLLESWGTIKANFTERSDLQLFQKIRFEGHENIPAIDYRIVDIAYSVALADVRCSITAIPVRKFSIEKQLQRALAGDEATEMEAVARAVIKSLPPALTGTAGSAVGTGSVAVTLDRGGTITARGVAASGSRVLCTWAEGIGYVASVIAAAT